MQESNLDGPTLPLTDDSLQKYVKIERYEKKMHHKHWILGQSSLLSEDPMTRKEEEKNKKAEED